MERVDGYAPIRDYALIGDGRTVALIARDGSVDWLCLPNVDSPSVFARILDAERGGSFRLEPTAPLRGRAPLPRRLERARDDLRTAAGAGARDRRDDALGRRRRISPMRELVRKVEALAGTVQLRWAFEPRFGYGAGEDAHRAPRRPLVRARAAPTRSCSGSATWATAASTDGVVTGELALGPGSSAPCSRSPQLDARARS